MFRLDSVAFARCWRVLETIQLSFLYVFLKDRSVLKLWIFLGNQSFCRRLMSLHHLRVVEIIYCLPKLLSRFLIFCRHWSVDIRVDSTTHFEQFAELFFYLTEFMPVVLILIRQAVAHWRACRCWTLRLLHFQRTVASSRGLIWRSMASFSKAYFGWFDVRTLIWLLTYAQFWVHPIKQFRCCHTLVAQTVCTWRRQQLLFHLI